MNDKVFFVLNYATDTNKNKIDFPKHFIFIPSKASYSIIFLSQITHSPFPPNLDNTIARKDPITTTSAIIQYTKRKHCKPIPFPFEAAASDFATPTKFRTSALRFPSSTSIRARYICCSRARKFLRERRA